MSLHHLGISSFRSSTFSGYSVGRGFLDADLFGLMPYLFLSDVLESRDGTRCDQKTSL